MIPASPAHDAAGTFDGAGRTVAVAPTSTVIVGPQDTTKNPFISVYLKNTDALQTLNAWIETGPTVTGPWAREASLQLDQIVALDTRSARFDAIGSQFVRIMGLASGLGLNTTAWCWLGDRF